MKAVCLLVAVVSLFWFAHTIQPAQTDNHRVQVRIIEVIDGDTFVVEPVNNRFRVRLSNADTWESRQVNRAGSGKISPEEIAKGKAATKASSDLFSSSQYIYFIYKSDDRQHSPVTLDSFGRRLGEIESVKDSQTINLGVFLKANGHTRR